MITLETLRQRKRDGQKFSMLTAYDSSFSHVISSAGVDVMLVGDSLGMVIQGKESTLPVTIDDLVYHTQAVAAGNQGALIMSDVPFLGARNTDVLIEQAGRLMQAGANIVKVEGGIWLTDQIARLKQNGIPVCVHLGLTPQFINSFGGYKIQGKSEEQALAMAQAAKAVEMAGADMILLECVPNAAAEGVMSSVSVPVVGIGAGPSTDAQVLVIQDMLGMTPGRKPRFVKDFLAGHQDGIQAAIERFDSAVKSGEYPAPEHQYGV
ncbi:MAG: 3-methyl-2-oxobutanoate hydroxymethyltransferase [Pseudomonadota bacterium]|nr:3-methyl-2-oxobutanoate hydroxymethyltransferase [Pseudomonadota bacterium]